MWPHLRDFLELISFKAIDIYGLLIGLEFTLFINANIPGHGVLYLFTFFQFQLGYFNTRK